MTEQTKTSSPFLNLPTEIRLQIYGYLLAPCQDEDPLRFNPSVATAQYHQYTETSEASSQSTPKTLQIRIIDPQPSGRKDWAMYILPSLTRSKILIRTDRFRARTMQTTYTALNNPGIHAAILSTCRQCHGEGAEVLYGSHIWDFDAHVEAVGAFLADLTPTARGFIRSVGVVKRASPYDRDFDRCEWAGAMQALSSLPALRTLYLGVVAGKPGLEGWDGVPVWSKGDFESMVRWRAWAGLEWVRDLKDMTVCKEKGRVEVRAIVEHCPMPSSEGMMFWLGVSRNVEGGFAEWVRDLVMRDECEGD